MDLRCLFGFSQGFVKKESPRYITVVWACSKDRLGLEGTAGAVWHPAAMGIWHESALSQTLSQEMCPEQTESPTGNQGLNGDWGIWVCCIGRDESWKYQYIRMNTWAVFLEAQCLPVGPSNQYTSDCHLQTFLPHPCIICGKNGVISCLRHSFH